METEVHITSEEAAEIARAALAGKVDLPPDTSAHVRLMGGAYIVVFPYALPPGVRGPDYHAKVTVNAESGEVLEILAGS